MITGLGAVSCCGIGAQRLWSAVRQGRSGISRVDHFDVSQLSCKVAGVVRDFDPLDFVSAKKARKQGRFVHLALAAAREAMQDAGLDPLPLDPKEVGAALGSSGAGMGNISDDAYTDLVLKGLGHVDGGVIVEVPPHAATSHVSIELGLKGPTMSNSTGCATSLVAIAQGADALRNGLAKVMVVGASEACVSPFVYGLLCRLRVLTTDNSDPARSCRPFDKNRHGLVLSEAAAVLVLELADHAMNRGARIYGEVLGYGMASEAYHMVMSPPTGEEMARALHDAIVASHISPRDLDYVCVHGIGNQQYDVTDTRGLKLELGDHAYHIPVSSIKAVVGQPFAAAGALQTVVTCMSLETNTVPPTINYETPDEQCDLDYVPNVARTARVDTAAVNSHSFGGSHAAVVLRRFAEN